MKLKLFVLCTFLSITAFGQSFLPDGGGEVLIPRNNEPCLSPEHRQTIQDVNAQNIAMLETEGRLFADYNSEGNHPLFIWPFSQAAGFDYESNWVLINYVDHNTAFPNQITDYNCGSRSYDTTNGYNHQGFDINPFPFWWKQMEDNQAINVAAADGQIINKSDGNFDKNCGFNNDQPNFVILQHSDGSVSWYLHMKSGTLTDKNIGDFVSQGEFLGGIGSSGSSTAPHIHFEVYDSNDNLVDPSTGTCNSLNADTWWLNQKPYQDAKINTVLSHSDPPIFPTCPETEVPNLQDQFSSGEEALLAIYLTDALANSSVFLKTIRPDGTTQFEWEFAIDQDYFTAYWYWNIVPDMDGEWTWEATYSGNTVSHNFNVGVLGTEDNTLQKTTIAPNPVTDVLTVISEVPITKVTVYDIAGRSVVERKGSAISSIYVEALPKGIFFVNLSIDDAQKTIKIVKE